MSIDPKAVKLSLRYSDDFVPACSNIGGDKPYLSARDREIARFAFANGLEKAFSKISKNAVKLVAREDGDFNLFHLLHCRVRGAYWGKVGVASFAVKGA